MPLCTLTSTCPRVSVMKLVPCSSSAVCSLTWTLIGWKHTHTHTHNVMYTIQQACVSLLGSLQRQFVEAQHSINLICTNYSVHCCRFIAWLANTTGKICFECFVECLPHTHTHTQNDIHPLPYSLTHTHTLPPPPAHTHTSPVASILAATLTVSPNTS